MFGNIVEEETVDFELVVDIAGRSLVHCREEGHTQAPGEEGAAVDMDILEVGIPEVGIPEVGILEVGILEVEETYVHTL